MVALKELRKTWEGNGEVLLEVVRDPPFYPTLITVVRHSMTSYRVNRYFRMVRDDWEVSVDLETPKIENALAHVSRLFRYEVPA